jgi:hypothetical protein
MTEVDLSGGPWQLAALTGESPEVIETAIAKLIFAGLTESEIVSLTADTVASGNKIAEMVADVLAWVDAGTVPTDVEGDDDGRN